MTARAALDGVPVAHLDLDEARSLDEAADMAASALAASIADAAPRERVVVVRWHDGRRATRRIVA